MTEKEMLSKVIAKEKRLFLALVHPGLYGPLRGINGILKNPNVDDVDKLLSSPRDTQFSLIRKAHLKTGLATQIMVLPNEVISEAEDGPEEFETINELMEFMSEEIGKAPDMAKDPYYFRLGKI